MKFVALLSGGKDSILALLMAYRFHHEPVVVANIAPSASLQSQDEHEVDSYMYQTVGHEAVEAMVVGGLQLPLRRSFVDKHQALDQSMHYTEEAAETDEVESLYRLLKSIKEEFPEVEGVTSGAILSNYQRHRVENVCYRLGLVSLAYLWHRPGREILDMAHHLRVKAILVKTASGGLLPRVLLGKTLEEARPTLEMMETRYGGHMAGEGGEFESLVLDCPFFLRSYLVVREQTLVMVDDNAFSPSGHWKLTCIVCEEKTTEEKKLAEQWYAKLRDGEFVFASDSLPGLPTTPPFPSPPFFASSLSSTGKDEYCATSVEEDVIGKLVKVADSVSSLWLLSFPLRQTLHCSPPHAKRKQEQEQEQGDRVTRGGETEMEVCQRPPLLFLVTYKSNPINWRTLTEEDIKLHFEQAHHRVAVTLNTLRGNSTSQGDKVSLSSSMEQLKRRKCCLHYLIDCPHPEVIPMVDTVYRTSVPLISPPGCTILSSPSSRSRSSIHFFIVASPYLAGSSDAHAITDKLHNQSRSCWAAGRPGPYAQGWRIRLHDAVIEEKEEQGECSSEEKDRISNALPTDIVFIGGAQGRVPATNKLAKTEDLPLVVGSVPQANISPDTRLAGPPAIPASHCAEEGEAERRKVVVAEEGEEKEMKNNLHVGGLQSHQGGGQLLSCFSASSCSVNDIMAQFAYAFANAARYGMDSFHKNPEEASLVTIIVSPVFTKEYMLQYRACPGSGNSSLVTRTSNQNALKKYFYHLLVWCCPNIFKNWKTTCEHSEGDEMRIPFLSSSSSCSSAGTVNSVPLVEILLNTHLSSPPSLVEVFIRWN